MSERIYNKRWSGSKHGEFRVIIDIADLSDKAINPLVARALKNKTGKAKVCNGLLTVSIFRGESEAKG